MDDIKKKRIVTPQQALLKLMRLCSLSEKCSGDAIRLMKKWEIDQTNINSILESLIADKYIDDCRYTQLFVKEKVRFSGWGERKISQALRLKGLDSKIVAQALASCDKSSSKEKLKEILAKKYNSIKDKETDKYKLKDKLFRFAASRGYEFDDIISALENSSFNI